MMPPTMRRLMRESLVLCALCLAAPTAQANQGPFLNLGLLYLTKDSIDKEEFSTSEATASSTLINLAAGFSFGGGLLVGAKYVQDNYVGTNGANAEADTTMTMSAAGLSLGFKSGPLAALVSGMALQAPTRKTTSGSRTKTKVRLYGGGGTMIDLMYLVGAADWGFGPQITWRSFTYKKRVSQPPAASDQALVSLSESELIPYISFFVSF